MKPNALLCTVGTSMFSKSPELRGLSSEEAAARLGGLLRAADGGAEYETLHRHCHVDDLIDRDVLYLFCSDTDDGVAAGRILQACFRADFHGIEVARVKDLRDGDPRVFATRGLRRLVNELIRTVQKLRKDGYGPAIDATGGYKPQIAHAVLVGQVLQVPVFYRYQGFPEVIKLPPLPVSVDPQVWFDHLWFFERLRQELLYDRDIPRGDERVTPLIDREDRLVTLSPLGELMAAAADEFLFRHWEDLLPPPSQEPAHRKKIVYEDGNAGKHDGLEEFCGRIRAVPFVTRISTFYFNPDLPRRSSVRLPREHIDVPDRLEVWYGDGTALTKLNVWTTARNNRELAAARLELARRLAIQE